jgi:hypothetical protein
MRGEDIEERVWVGVGVGVGTNQALDLGRVKKTSAAVRSEVKARKYRP